MTQMADTLIYPPYGFMIAEFEPKQPKEQPEAWTSNVDFPAWHGKMVDLLSQVLWPSYDRKAQQWVGSAAEFMHDLTVADFELFPRFRPLFLGNSPVPGKKHVDLFKLEDEGDFKFTMGDLTIVVDRSLDSTLKLYLDGKVDADQAADLVGKYIPRLKTHSGAIDLYLKIDMQRPRPYQTAWRLGKDFSHQWAKSALTPALISGHCFQTMMGGAATYLRAVELGCPQPALDAVAQHTIDVADRRVFAGVHYASDNISSWLTGLLACSHVFPSNAAAEWLWDAIVARSPVYREIRKAIDAGTGEAYRPSIDLLERIGSGEIRTVEEAIASLGDPPTAVAA